MAIFTGFGITKQRSQLAETQSGVSDKKGVLARKMYLLDRLHWRPTLGSDPRAFRMNWHLGRPGFTGPKTHIR
jgi:hypothetical protein